MIDHPHRIRRRLRSFEVNSLPVILISDPNIKNKGVNKVLEIYDFCQNWIRKVVKCRSQKRIYDKLRSEMKAVLVCFVNEGFIFAGQIAKSPKIDIRLDQFTRLNREA